MIAVQETLDALFHELADGVCIVEKAGGILYMNTKARVILGLKDTDRPVSLCQSLCARLVGHGGANLAKACPLLLEPGQRTSLTLQGTWPHVSYDWAGFHIIKREQATQLRVRCLKASTDLFGPGHGEIHFVLIQDVTHEGELERHKEDWRSMAAHDLRSPLTNIFGALRVLQEAPHGKPLDGGERQLLDIGARSCRRMIELLDLYLDIAKLDAEQMPVELVPLVLLDEVWACVEEQQPFLTERGVKVALDVEESLRVTADRDLLPRVIQNLINNAAKFSPAGSEVSVTAMADKEGKTRLEVLDRGPGIPPEELPLVFDRFHQAKARREGKTQGTGLGLTFCREAMRVMRGEIDVESKPGWGSRFTLTMPTAPGEP